MRKIGAILGGVTVGAAATLALSTPGFASSKAYPKAVVKKLTKEITSPTTPKAEASCIVQLMEGSSGSGVKAVSVKKAKKMNTLQLLSWEISNSTNIATNCSMYAKTTPSSAPAAPTTTAPSGPLQLAVGQGDTVGTNGQDQATVSVTAVSATTQPGDPEFGEPPANGYYLIVTVSVAATANGFDINPLDFYADVNGTHYNEGDGNAFEALADSSTELDATTLNAGENTSGPIVFDVPSPHGQIVYAPNYGGAPLAEWTY